jgi:hypothetical protein
VRERARETSKRARERELASERERASERESKSGGTFMTRTNRYGQEYNAQVRTLAAKYKALNYPEFAVVTLVATLPLRTSLLW